MPNLRVVLEYDGRAFHGWQRQPGLRTVQGVVEAAVSSIAGRPVKVAGAGRTDRGVHALGQVASFTTDRVLPAESWRRALNALLPPDVAAREVKPVPDGFHARRSARGKLYRYRILTGETRSPLEAGRCWHVRHPLDLRAMRRAARALLGRRAFDSFALAGHGRRNTVREIRAIRLARRGEWLTIEIEANGFLWGMARAIVGTLVEVGRGKTPAGRIPDILEARNRSAAGPAAPPEGLFLVRVLY